jgi:hypothetical protein
MNYEQMTTRELCDEADRLDPKAYFDLCEADQIIEKKDFRNKLIKIIYPKINSYSHVYLYAKHWYKRTDVVADMKILIGKRCGIAPKHISTENCVEQLVDLVWLSISRSGNPIHFFSEFVLDVTLRKNRWKFTDEPDDNDEVVVIKKCLSVLALTNKKDIDGEFEEPNPKILPLSDEGTLARFRKIKGTST